MKTCPGCGGEVNEEVVDNYEVRWGRPESEHGQLVFTIDGVRYFKCLGNCYDGEFSFFTSEQFINYEHLVNEQLKARIGFDWLTACKERRLKRRSKKL